jgi:hypothetical protein
MSSTEVSSRTTQIRHNAANTAVSMAILSVVYSYFQGRLTAHVLAIAISCALVGLVPWWVYHHRSGRDDGLSIVMFAVIPAMRGWGESTDRVLVLMGICFLMNLGLAFLSASAMASKSKPTNPSFRTLWDTDIDSRS